MIRKAKNHTPVNLTTHATLAARIPTISRLVTLQKLWFRYPTYNWKGFAGQFAISNTQGARGSRFLSLRPIPLIHLLIEGAEIAEPTDAEEAAGEEPEEASGDFPEVKAVDAEVAEEELEELGDGVLVVAVGVFPNRSLDSRGVVFPPQYKWSFLPSESVHSPAMNPAHRTTETECSAIGLLEVVPILGNGYFRALESGEMTQKDFARSQVQFFYAVGFFSRNLAALIARLPTSAGRAVLVHNLSEEHGLDEENPGEGFRAHLAHDRTFARFLETLGEGLEESYPEPPVQAFNLALLGACASEQPGFALAALGIIEYAFADISALIGRRVVELGWVKSGELVHYSVHAEIDKRHAAELFEAAEESCEDGETLTHGLAFGRYIFDRLYVDLTEENL